MPVDSPIYNVIEVQHPEAAHEVDQLADCALQPVLDEQKLAEHVNKLMQSAATQSIIANAVSRGAGSMVGNIIVGSIFKAIKVPFEIGSEAVATIDSAADAIYHVASASHNFAAAAKDIKQITTDTAEQVTQAVKTFNSALTSSGSANEKQLDKVHTAVMASAPLPDVGSVADYKKRRVGTRLPTSTVGTRSVK